MNMEKQINFDLSNVANGGLQEKLDRALNQVTENIMDPNTDQTKKRKITINLVFEPSKSGDASVADVKVHNPVSLAPYRTFLEVEQPISKFIFRMRSGMRSAIFEADGGMWRNVAIRNIRDFLADKLKNELENKKITILA